ncbi:MAG: SsrA-binding protein SmpB [Actinobacteria bacterium]|nr:SsrA-binding protein SmpB [Actinomycetota bacterium]
MNQLRILATNKKAYHDYFIDEKYECGIELHGSEVKSIRSGKVSIKESFGRIENGEVWLYDMYIAPYEASSVFAPDPRRKRKLLLKKEEIRRLIGKIKEKGYTLIPLSVYLKGRYVKVELGLARGKKKFDKRREIAEKEAKKRLEQALRIKQKGR